MSQRMYVVAAEGRSVPMEASSGMIQGDPIAVIDSHYYRRRIAEGDLRVVDAPTEPNAGNPAATAEAPRELPAAAKLTADAAETSTEPTPTTSRRRAAP